MFEQHILLLILPFYSIGRLLRAIAESDPKSTTDDFTVKEALSAGEMIPKRILEKIIDNQLIQLRNKVGVIIDGYPRDIDQAKYFETKVCVNNFN